MQLTQTGLFVFRIRLRRQQHPQALLLASPTRQGLIVPFPVPPVLSINVSARVLWRVPVPLPRVASKTR